jgi:LPS O-antigen subunit length determinant protein (WzzB/FepE family)
MKRNNAPILWTVISLVVFCILVVGATYFAVETKSKDAILTEIAKAFIQLGTVGVLGALVKFTFDQISEFRRKQQVDLEAKRELLEQLRKLKHVVRTTPFRIEEERSLEAYRQEMRALLNAYMEISDFGMILASPNLSIHTTNE